MDELRKIATETFNSLPNDLRKKLCARAAFDQLRDLLIERHRAEASHRAHIEKIDEHRKNIERSLKELEKEIIL